MRCDQAWTMWLLIHIMNYPFAWHTRMYPFGLPFTDTTFPAVVFGSERVRLWSEPAVIGPASIWDRPALCCAAKREGIKERDRHWFNHIIGDGGHFRPKELIYKQPNTFTPAIIAKWGAGDVPSHISLDHTQMRYEVARDRSVITTTCPSTARDITVSTGELEQ